QVAAARDALEKALARVAEVVREADPALGVEAIKARHKQFDELWPLVIQTVRRVDGRGPTSWALYEIWRREDQRHLNEQYQSSKGFSQKAIEEMSDDEIPF